MDDTEVKALESLSKRDLIAIVLHQRAQIEELRQQNRQLQQRTERLEEELARTREELAKARKDSSNSSKPPSSDIVNPRKDKTSNGPGKQGGQRGHPGVNRTPFGPDQIDRIEELHPAGGCPHGHDAPLEPLGELKIQHVVTLREDPLEIIEYRRYGHRCPICAEVVWAELPPGVVEGQLFDRRFWALIAYMKGALHASYSNLQSFCRDVLGIEVARSHLCNTIARVNEALAAPHQALDYFGFNGAHERILHGAWYMKNESYCRPDLDVMRERVKHDVERFKKSGRRLEDIVACMLTDEPTGQPASFAAQDEAYRQRFREWLKAKSLRPDDLLVAGWDDVRPVARIGKLPRNARNCPCPPL